MKKALNRIESSLQDSVFKRIYKTQIQAYRHLINQSKVQAAGKKHLANCLNGKNMDSELRTKIETLEEEKFELQKELIDLKSACNSDKNQGIVIRTLENDKHRKEQQLEVLEEKYERLKEEKGALTLGYNTLFDETIRSLDDMEVKGFCNKSKFKRAKSKIIKTINEGKRALHRP